MPQVPERFSVTCSMRASPTRSHHLRESHMTLASAIEALLEHQQRDCWDSVALGGEA